MAFNGLFKLRTPPDLLRKLQHDLDRMDKGPLDQFAAFDFFTTADCIVDWIHPDKSRSMDNKEEREALRNSNVLLRIVSHIANGSKHFQALGRHHNSVVETEKFRYTEEGYAEPGYFHEPLLIHLNHDEALELGNCCVDYLEATKLARKVVEYWAKNLQIDS